MLKNLQIKKFLLTSLCPVLLFQNTAYSYRGSGESDSCRQRKEWNCQNEHTFRCISNDDNSINAIQASINNSHVEISQTVQLMQINSEKLFKNTDQKNRQEEVYKSFIFSQQSLENNLKQLIKLQGIQEDIFSLVKENLNEWQLVLPLIRQQFVNLKEIRVKQIEKKILKIKSILLDSNLNDNQVSEYKTVLDFLINLNNHLKVIDRDYVLTEDDLNEMTKNYSSKENNELLNKIGPLNFLILKCSLTQNSQVNLKSQISLFEMELKSQLQLAQNQLSNFKENGLQKSKESFEKLVEENQFLINEGTKLNDQKVSLEELIQKLESSKLPFISDRSTCCQRLGEWKITYYCK